ncbi:MAG: histidine kinase [Clostridia bacterium]|nr:histidine kinase [Clostridia bacterium]
MRYRNKMILLYTAFVLVLSLAIGVTYYEYNSARLREREQQSLDFHAREVMQHFDASVEMLDYAIKTQVYSVDVVNALRICAYAGQNPDYPKEYYIDALLTLNNKLYTGPIENFYRIIVFNRFGHVVANRSNGKFGIDPNVSWEDIPWLDKVEGRGGKSVLIGVHEDDWGRQERPMVYSYVKELQGEDLGYIEVQQEQAYLGEILHAPDDGTQIYLFDPEGGLMFASQADVAAQELYGFAARLLDGEGGATPMGSAVRSRLTGACALAMLPDAALRAESMAMLRSTLIVVAVFAMASMLFVYVISSYLTKPVERMQEVIVRTQIENIGQSVASEKDSRELRSISEVSQLMDAYQDMTDRLSKAIEAERTTARLYMNSQFDALQAQVNPHFLFNVLNVISQRGMIDDDDLICEICANLAAILRYSTNTKQRLATVEEELNYLSQYAFLQKTRYQERFEYRSDVDDAVLPMQIPRLTIQQLVENSMHHGYQDTAAKMVISVSAKRGEGRTVIAVHDQGTGFAEDRVASILEQFAQTRSDLRNGRRMPNLEIGGMGLVNVYARLYLIFGERFDMTIINDGGSTVSILIRDA